MSEENKTPLDVGKAELIEAMKSAFSDLVAELLEDAKGDINAFVQQITQEYGRNLWRTIRDGDQVAHGNLDDLKAQIMLIAVKRQIVIARETMERLKSAAEIALKIAVKTLLAVMA